MPSSDRDGNAITLPLSADPMSSSDRGVNAIAATSGGEWQTGTAIVHGRLDLGDLGPGAPSISPAERQASWRTSTRPWHGSFSISLRISDWPSMTAPWPANRTTAMSSRYVALHGLKPPVNAASPLGHRRSGTAEARRRRARYAQRESAFGECTQGSGVSLSIVSGAALALKSTSAPEGQAAAKFLDRHARSRPIFPFDLSGDRHGHGLDQCEPLPKFRPSFPT